MMRMLAYTHIHTHIHAHTCTHIHTHAHTHTHIRIKLEPILELFRAVFELKFRRVAKLLCCYVRP